MRVMCFVVTLLVGCGTKESGEPPGGSGDTARVHQPQQVFPVAFGDCGAATDRFVSGPRPSKPKAPDPYPPHDPDRLETGVNTPAALEKASAVEAVRVAGLVGDGLAFDEVGVRARSRRSAAVPRVSIRHPVVKGDLATGILRRYVKRNIQKVQYCYEKALLADPDLEGIVTVEFTIAPDGTVEKSTGNGVSAEVSRCVADVVKAIEFPKPNAGRVEVSYPLEFQYGGEPSTSPASPHVTRIYATDARWGGGPFDEAAVGQANPLRAQEPALASCFQASRTPFGAVVVELTYDATGAVTNASVHGIDDPTTNRCVAAAAQQARRATSGTASVQRCPIAFGAMPLASFATIDVTPSKPIGAAIAPGPPIEAVISMHLPWLVRTEPEVTMRTAISAWLAILGAGEDFILAAKRDGTWQPLRKRTFPTAPVVIGMGGHWAPLKGPPPKRATIDRKLLLSVLVGTNDIWVGFAHDNVLHQIDRGDLHAVLDGYKQSPAFAKATAIEIAGADDVTWGEVVTVIDSAEAVGFVDWELTEPALLDARPSL